MPTTDTDSSHLTQLKQRGDQLAALLNVGRVKRVELGGHSADFLTSMIVHFDDGTRLVIRTKHDHSLAIEQISD